MTNSITFRMKLHVCSQLFKKWHLKYSSLSPDTRNWVEGIQKFSNLMTFLKSFQIKPNLTQPKEVKNGRPQRCLAKPCSTLEYLSVSLLSFVPLLSFVSLGSGKIRKCTIYIYFQFSFEPNSQLCSTWFRQCFKLLQNANILPKS